MAKITLYFDACCLHRPLDDQNQDRVRLEAEAITIILKHVQSGDWFWIGSDVLQLEIDQNPDEEKRAQVYSLLQWQKRAIVLAETDFSRADSLQRLGFQEFDSFHVAAAERGKCDVLLTTDDRFLRRGIRFARRLKVEIANPVDWLKGALPS